MNNSVLGPVVISEEIPASLQKAFILGGNSKVVFHNPKTGNSLTYRIRQAKDSDKVFFVMAKVRDTYQYIGIITGDTFRTTAKSWLSADSVEVKGFEYVFNK